MGISPLITYMGALLTNPPLSTSAWAPDCSSLLATCKVSSSSMPPRKPSRMFIFTSTAMSLPAAFITSSITMSMNRIRFCREPPNSSLRWLVEGDRNWLIR